MRILSKMLVLACPQKADLPFNYLAQSYKMKTPAFQYLPKAQNIKGSVLATQHFLLLLSVA